LRSTVALAVILMTVLNVTTAAATAQTPSQAPKKVPLGLLPIQWPANNPYSPGKVELGQLL